MTACSRRCPRASVRSLTLACLTAAIPAGLPGASAAPLTHTLTPYTRGEVKFRWTDIADNPYSERFRKSFRYRPGQVTVTLAETETETLRGRLVAHGLKPNFTYQIKLEGLGCAKAPVAAEPADPAEWANRQIGTLGRWWCVNDDWNTWSDAYDSDYHKGHTILGYLLFDFFVTDAQGNAVHDFTVDSSFHVLWKVSQFPPGDTDGKARVFVVKADPRYGYSKPPKPATVSIYPEHEYTRPKPGTLRLPPGKYRCRLLLTEESFHSYGGSGKQDLGGRWTHCLSDDKLEFTILPSKEGNGAGGETAPGGDGIVVPDRRSTDMSTRTDTPAAGERWLHPLCKPLPTERNGPFVELADGSLMTVDTGMRVSRDDGRTWSEPTPICPGVNMGHPGHVGQILRTRDNTLLVVYLDFDGYHWAWDDDRGVPLEGCRLELWAIRSLDSGKTWQDRQRLLDGYNADFTGLIQTRSGGIVATFEHLAADPARWVACSFRSEDDGATWKRSNWIDLGGHGHHDGATEPSVAELSDGRLLMLIRTNLDRFWYAFSDDGGRYWRTVMPSPLDASGAPGHLLRLRSGRLALVWNRLNPEGREWPKAGPGPASEGPASWHREELSLAFSEDDGKSWTRPVVVARDKGAQLAYPYLFERRPGELWVFTRYTWDKQGKAADPLRVWVSEEEFLREAKR